MLHTSIAPTSATPLPSDRSRDYELIRRAIAFIQDRLGVTPQLAYTLCSVVLDLKISQLVNVLEPDDGAGHRDEETVGIPFRTQEKMEQGSADDTDAERDRHPLFQSGARTSARTVSS